MALERAPTLDGRVSSNREPGGVALLTIERAAKRNALSLHIKAELADAVSRCAADPEVRAIVLTGAGGVFVAGTDVAEMVEMNPLDHVHAQTDRVFTALRNCSKPLIAAVEAYALGGGCELALCCDIVIAGSSARFGQPEIRLGIMPGAGGTQRWVRAMGSYRALPYLLSGESLTAEDALAAGLISEVAPQGEALQRAMALATTIAALPPLAVKAIKASVKLGENAGLDAALAFERHNFQLLFGSHDQREGMRAFLEKRVAHFEGH
ncbi:enoyl-CoA hydratase-related protein [Peristeroidobacter soli]|jgi:enoyl-CoA hydratase/carnithine racemase|uniref:enoyl-CoA hydratase-related protein n=1 Tax=Peristeroidobacter soli TaxID=2497877 RepID=UPI00101CDC27|nr:enoyl-CoA hydratase-related protein [Peristeroidobacter soli]